MSPIGLRGAFFLALLALLALAPAVARADDWAVLLGAVEIREQAGFAKPVLSKSPEFALYKVLGQVEADGSQRWYEIVLREERKIRKRQAKGWVLQLPGEPDPLLRRKVPVYKTPSTKQMLGTRRSAELQLTGLDSPEGRWHEVTFEDRIENLRHELGYVPASLAKLFENPDLTELVPRIESIRSHPWPLRWKSECVRGRIHKGFPRAAVQLALGEPREIAALPVQRGNGEVWTYERRGRRVRIFLKSGKVVGWKSYRRKNRSGRGR